MKPGSASDLQRARAGGSLSVPVFLSLNGSRWQRPCVRSRQGERLGQVRSLDPAAVPAVVTPAVQSGVALPRSSQRRRVPHTMLRVGPGARARLLAGGREGGCVGCVGSSCTCPLGLPRHPAEGRIAWAFLSAWYSLRCALFLAGVRGRRGLCGPWMWTHTSCVGIWRLSSPDGDKWHQAGDCRGHNVATGGIFTEGVLGAG